MSLEAWRMALVDALEELVPRLQRESYDAGVKFGEENAERTAACRASMEPHSCGATVQPNDPWCGKCVDAALHQRKVIDRAERASSNTDLRDLSDAQRAEFERTSAAFEQVYQQVGEQAVRAAMRDAVVFGEGHIAVGRVPVYPPGDGVYRVKVPSIEERLAELERRFHERFD